MKVIVVYDDTGKKSEAISDIIGEKGFADVVIKKRRLEERYYEEIKQVYPDVIWRKIHSIFGYGDLINELEIYKSADIKVIHCFSNYMISDGKKAALSLKKLYFIDDLYAVMSEKKVVAGMFPSVDEYLTFCKSIIAGQKAWDIIGGSHDCFEIEGLVDISVINTFIQYITGDFDSRFFNSLQGNDFTLVKTSSNKAKIKAEYSFYHLLPDDMKYWFVMPFNYAENESSASYTMERLHMTDLSIKWVHGSMHEKEFEDLMNIYFYFFSSRHEKKCTCEDYKRIADNLYVTKVIERIEHLKDCNEYIVINKLLTAVDDVNIDDLVKKYLSLKTKIENKNTFPNRLVIGHGDPCFANALYNKSTKTLKFIDPKGAINEDELWTNPYYDIAKLSHSVCGSYDFFNNGLYDIRISSDFAYELEIPFDNSAFVEIFKKKLVENGFDYNTVRIYEASLFLSMLPLHIDNPHKVLGFILNVKNILKEIEEIV